MSKAQFVLLCIALFCVCLVAEAQQAKAPKTQEPTNLSAIEREVRDFYDAYADDLRRHRREAIADRYDPRGIYFLGNGRKSLEPFETVKNRYLTKWTGPKSFDWKEMSVEVLSDDSAVVLGRFDWQTAKGETMTYSYTGLLLKQSGKWRIRVEDESTQPIKPPAQ